MSSQDIVDLTIEPKDDLSLLPPELLHLIFDHLLPTHQPDLAFEDGAQRLNVIHPLDRLALTSHFIRDQVNDWARHWLQSHPSITKYKDLKTPKLQDKRDFLRGRSTGLLRWAERHCVFCGKGSARSAILANGLRCCGKCDKQQWPDKITKTKAKEEYDLKDYHLLPHQHPAIAVGGLPRIRYGMYFSSNIQTTMFLREDVRRLAGVVHGDVNQHMKAKNEATGERRRKKAAKEEEKRLQELELVKKSEPFRYARETDQGNQAAAQELQQLMKQAGVDVDHLKEGTVMLRMGLGLPLV